MGRGVIWLVDVYRFGWAGVLSDWLMHTGLVLAAVVSGWMMSLVMALSISSTNVTIVHLVRTTVVILKMLLSYATVSRVILML